MIRKIPKIALLIGALAMAGQASAHGGGWGGPAQGAGGPGVGQQVSILAERGPALPGAFKEVQIGGVGPIRICGSGAAEGLSRVCRASKVRPGRGSSG